jgi:ankyrin repeat protein
LLYDYVESRVELYDSADAGNLMMWTNLCSRSILQKSIFGNTNKKVITDYFLKKPTSADQANNFLECLFFDTLHSKTVLHLVIDNSQIFSAIIEKMLTMKEEELPYLMFADARGETPLDIAIKNQQNKNVVSLLKLMVYHKSASD